MFRPVDLSLSNFIKLPQSETWNTYTFRLFSIVRSKSKTIRDSKKDANFILNQKKVSKQLEELLNVRSFVSSDIVLKHKKFLEIPTYSVRKNYYACVSQGIEKDTLIKFPAVLAEPDIPIKIEQLRNLPYDINITAPLLLMKTNTLKTLISNEELPKRIELISEQFEVEGSKVCEWVSEKHFLASLNFKDIEDKIQLLLESGVTKEEITNDLWVLKYSLGIIKTRLEMIKTNDVQTVKTWMIRAPASTFNTYVKRRSDTKLILGDSSLVEYLSERLECSETEAKHLISKHLPLQKKNLKRIKQMIDFLVGCGFKPADIRRTPKILLHSVETIQRRIKELQAVGMRLNTLHILTKSRRQYMHYYESLKDNKRKTKR